MTNSALPLTPAIRVILRARKGSRADLRLRDGLVLHEADGRYTAKAEAVLRHGEALELAGEAEDSQTRSHRRYRNVRNRTRSGYYRLARRLLKSDP